MAEPEWDWTWQEKIPNSEEAGREAIRELLSVMQKFGWEGRDYFHVQMAAEEAMVNAVKHGNGHDPHKHVEIEFKLSSSTVQIRLKDEGSGFDPEDLPDPRDDDYLDRTNGRGVMLIREMMDEVQYAGGGNEVIMIKHRSASDSV